MQEKTLSTIQFGGLSVLLMQRHTQTKEYDYQKQYHGSRRILVVDDEPDITSFFKQALRDNGFEVETANDPLLALKNFKEHHHAYDLLVIDIVMPEMDGFSLYEEIRK
ncbi:MAG: response regulator, partial [Candidatus Nitrosopolaris sp.]